MFSLTCDNLQLNQQAQKMMLFKNVKFFNILLLPIYITQPGGKNKNYMELNSQHTTEKNTYFIQFCKFLKESFLRLQLMVLIGFKLQIYIAIIIHM